MLESAYSRAGHLIRRAYQIAQALFLDETAELGLTPVQYSALNAINELPSRLTRRRWSRCSIDWSPKV
jgi:DNA-binding MarR family transcriptional regulator